MKVSLEVLRRFTSLPDSDTEVRELLDDIGVEVKRIGDGTMTLELLANRGDHHAYAGIAREVVGRTGQEVVLPDIADLVAGESPWPVAVETEQCLVYTATMLEKREEGTLDADADAVLAAAGIHSLGPVVDASNIVNLELGQPTHCFDADTIVGAVTIRLSREGEQAHLLFHDQRIELPVDTMVIADDEKILAVAGVIGCEESKTTSATKRVLLESAAFDPVAVRKASRGLGIQTDSSARFERGSDPTLPLVGAGRVVHLLETAGWARTGLSGVFGSWEDPVRIIVLNTEATRRFVGIEHSDEEMTERLRRYGFVVDVGDGVLHVRVPPHRLWDVEYPQDLYEELAKSVGYNSTDIALPPVEMGSLASEQEQARYRVEDVLVGLGFYEVITDGFYERATRERLGLTEDHPLWPHVETTNAVDRAYSLLKNNCLAQAVETVAINLRRAHPEVKAFEFTRTFHPGRSLYNEVCSERPVLWAVVNGLERPGTWAVRNERLADPVFLKGVVAEIARQLGVELEVGLADETHALYGHLHPQRQAAIRSAGRVVGVLGEVHPLVLRGFKIKRARPSYLELDAAALRIGHRAPFVEPPTWHPVVRNLAFTLPMGVGAGDVLQTMRDAGPTWLWSVQVVDRYVHEVDGASVSTWTFELAYANADAQRTAEEVNAVTDELIAAVTSSFGDQGVSLR